MMSREVDVSKDLESQRTVMAAARRCINNGRVAKRAGCTFCLAVFAQEGRIADNVINSSLHLR